MPAITSQDLQQPHPGGLAEALDGTAFREDRLEAAGAEAAADERVLVEGGVFEKAGVNFSDVHGEMSEEFAKPVPGEGRDFTACGISLVLHPRSPMVPTVHANFRFLTKGDRQWFGGGADLTPYYPYREDVVHFHQVWQRVCHRHAPLVDYAAPEEVVRRVFLSAAPRRGRAASAASSSTTSKAISEALFAFVRDCGDAFLDAYLPIAAPPQGRAIHASSERDFQEYRRGRYVEFNLVYDRGTLFGLKTGGRTESILMSLPPVVAPAVRFPSRPGIARGGTVPTSTSGPSRLGATNENLFRKPASGGRQAPVRSGKQGLTAPARHFRNRLSVPGKPRSEQPA